MVQRAERERVRTKKKKTTKTRRNEMETDSIYSNGVCLGLKVVPDDISVEWIYLRSVEENVSRKMEDPLW